MAKHKRTGATVAPHGGLNRRGERLLSSVPKDMRRWVKLALHDGWVLEHHGTHATLRSPDGYRCPIPSNPNNALRTVFRNQLRAHGVPLPEAC